MGTGSLLVGVVVVGVVGAAWGAEEAGRQTFVPIGPTGAGRWLVPEMKMRRVPMTDVSCSERVQGGLIPTAIRARVELIPTDIQGMTFTLCGPAAGGR